ncbi:MAG: hypothetical protein M1828_005881 [Chrysothrix sp. TS-e1954]|nr:MAG: hypothetical protein M1828_005881 [Chrysothrix sp. TS-e1954]
MEPFTIVVGVTGLCSTVISASSRLYTFINASKNVHRSVKDLKAEVDTLGKAISSIKPVLESQISSTNQDNAQSEEDKELWLSVQSTISECRATLDRLQESLVNAPSKEVDMGTQAIRTIKFNMRSEEINSTRVQVRSHTSALQLILQMIDLRATYLTPSLIINELGPKIDGLRALLEPDEENHVIPTSAVHPHHPERLHRTALRVLSSATTVSEASVYSPSIMGERMDEEVSKSSLFRVISISLTSTP